MNSLYHKTCPRCAATNSTSAGTCSCGYRFDQVDTSEEERLYAEYLAARAKQTAEAAITAEARRKAAPQDPRTAAEAVAAIQAAEQARKELSEQMDRVTALKVQPPTAPVAEAPRPQNTVKTREPPKVVAASAPAAQRHTPPARLVPAQPAPSKQAAKPQTCPVCSATVPAGRSLCGCGYSFAPPELPSLGEPAPVAKPAAPKREIVPAPSAEAIGKARLAREAERVAQRLVQKNKNCPHCTAQVAGDATRCQCGFVFVEAAAPLMPSLGLDSGDQDKIDSVLKPK